MAGSRPAKALIKAQSPEHLFEASTTGRGPRPRGAAGARRPAAADFTGRGAVPGHAERHVQLRHVHVLHQAAVVQSHHRRHQPKRLVQALRPRGLAAAVRLAVRGRAGSDRIGIVARSGHAATARSEQEHRGEHRQKAAHPGARSAIGHSYLHDFLRELTTAAPTPCGCARSRRARPGLRRCTAR